MEVKESIKIDWGCCSNLGEISDKVEKVYKIEDENYLVLSKEKILFSNFKGNFVPIILEKLKDLFEINKNGIQVAKLSKKNIVLHRTENTMNLKTYLFENNLTLKKLPLSFKKEVRKIIAFKWIFCLKIIKEASIYVRVIPETKHKEIKLFEILSFNENTVSYFDDSISQKLINDWFDNGFEGFYDTCKELINDRDISFLRLQIQKIIETYDRDLVSWTNEIFRRLLSFY
jgi:hypothetical protein